MRRVGVLMNTTADDPEQQSGVAVFLQALPIVGRATYVIRANLLLNLCPKAEDGNRRKSVLQRARQRSG
jgi:hypothetical protein